MATNTQHSERAARTVERVAPETEGPNRCYVPFIETDLIPRGRSAHTQYLDVRTGAKVKPQTVP